MKRAGWWAGLVAPFTAMGYYLGRPRLWKYGIWPLLLNGLLFDVLAFLAPVFLALLLLLLGAGAFLLLAGLLGAPFYDRMAQQMEAELFADRPELLSPPMTLWESVAHSLKEFLRRGALALPFFLIGLALNLIPGLGSLLSGIWMFAFGAVFLLIDALSYPLDRRGVSLGAKLRWIRLNAPATPGMACGLALLFAIPGAFLFAPLLAAIAGTRLYCAAERARQDLSPAP